MNDVLTPSWSETIGRLAVGIEPRDAATGQRVRHGVVARLETELTPVRERLRFGPADTLTDVLPRLSQHSSNRFAITMARTHADRIRVRLVDAPRWYIPRRFSILLADHDDIVERELDPERPTPSAQTRVVRPLLHPGAAYPRPPRATGLVGRVLRAGAPMRWARVRVIDRNTNREIVVAPGDDRGEFTVLLGHADDGMLPTGAVPVRLTVFGPEEVPNSDDDPERPDLDQLWDLPVEDLPVPAVGLAPDVEAGTAIPAGYVESSTGPIDVDLPLGVLLTRDAPEFTFAAP